MESKTVAIVALAILALISTNIIVQSKPVGTYTCTWENGTEVETSKVWVSTLLFCWLSI